mmetsp:Transcript_3281/g.20436  ORF Transcript_3281/g.20436 Transcript_3281/m.20436 type:complete len:84 (+) Transcript_3281:812-1063(+)
MYGALLVQATQRICLGYPKICPTRSELHGNLGVFTTLPCAQGCKIFTPDVGVGLSFPIRVVDGRGIHRRCHRQDMAIVLPHPS